MPQLPLSRASLVAFFKIFGLAGDLRQCPPKGPSHLLSLRQGPIEFFIPLYSPFQQVFSEILLAGKGPFFLCTVALLYPVSTWLRYSHRITRFGAFRCYSFAFCSHSKRYL